MATQRQLDLLLLLVKEYIRTSEAISSQTILNQYPKNFKLSSATIRIELHFLEQDGYIKRGYKTQGRIPTNKAYEYYLEKISLIPPAFQDYSRQLEAIFTKRNNDLNSNLRDAVKLINEVTSGLIVTKENNDLIRLADLKVYKTTEKQILIIAISSIGKVYNKMIDLPENEMEGFIQAFSTFAKKLIGNKIIEIPSLLGNLKTIINLELFHYEAKIKKAISLLIETMLGYEQQLIGMKSLFNSQSSLLKHSADFQKILEIIESNSVWDLLKYSEHQINIPILNNTKILLGTNENDNFSIIHKNYQIGDQVTDLAFLSPKNQDYETILNLLKLIDKKIEGGDSS